MKIRSCSYTIGSSLSRANRYVLVADQWTRLCRDTRRTQKMAAAEGTRSNLRTQWRTYLLFCEYFDIQALPASSETMCYYVEFLKRSFTAIASIKNYLSGVRQLHALHDLPCSSDGQLLLKMTLRGAAKALFREPKRAPPMTVPAMLALWRITNFSDHLDCTMFCIFVFAFFCFARKSSLFPPRRDAFSAELYPTRADVEKTSFGLLLHLKFGKSNQFGNKNRRIPLHACPSSPLCPVRAFSLLSLACAAPPSAPLFSLPSSRTLVSMDNGVFESNFRRMLAAAGLQDAGFTPHSFRRGGATAAFQAGLPSEVIQSIGGWSSDCYRIYLEHDLVPHTLALTQFVLNDS